MNELIKFLSEFHPDAPPFISENEDGSFSLVGSSDLAVNGSFEYEGLGVFKLTAKNHSNALIELMNFILLVDEMSDHEELSFEDKEVIAFLEFQFEHVINRYFGKEISFSLELALALVHNHPQLVNEALYNITKDKDQIKHIDYQSQSDSLDGSQFVDPYISIAYEVAKEFKMRPLDIVENWGSAELIVTYAKIANDHSLESFLSWKYSQKGAPKRKAPRKQAFYFEEIDEKGEETNE